MNRSGIEVRLGCVYRHTWDDGFGARGWKLDATLNDPNIVASTPVTGARIPTSVLVHDILDHALCGLPASGHRAEAVALLQLAARTGSDPRPDLAQMVDEDLMAGQADGETLWDLLPRDLRALLPPGLRAGGPIIARLTQALGRGPLRERLIAHLWGIGMAGAEGARRCYRAHGLCMARRPALGIALQRLFEQADARVGERTLLEARAEILIEARRCRFEILAPSGWGQERRY